MSRPLRIALIGAGTMGSQHAGYIADEPGATLAATADPVSATVASAYGVQNYSDHRQMLERVAPDAAIIANPNDLHVATALDCLKAGIPALLEKPVAPSRDQASQLAETQKKHGTPILVGHHRRHSPVVAAAKEIIGDGKLGRLVTVTAMWQTVKPDDYFEMAWHRKPGAGVVLINLVHDLDLLRHLCGEIISVHATTNNAIRNLEVEDSAIIQMEFEHGALGSLVGSDAAVSPWGWDQNVEHGSAFAKHRGNSCYYIAGTKGALSVPQLQLWRYPGQRGWKHELTCTPQKIASGNPYQQQLRHFISVAKGKAEPIVSVEDAGRTMAVIDAVHDAATTGRCTAPNYF